MTHSSTPTASAHSHPSADPNLAWWQGAVIYQIYPRSFADSNGDGIGDLGGIIAKLDYIQQLGVDAIWISPFYKSPMADFGYDVEDYQAVDPMFGSMEDFDKLLAEAHARGIKVVIDGVFSHTSDEHPWFKESRQNHKNPKADWYVWANPGSDGGPPNNWLSVFGGSSWEWDPRRRQYYLHNFLKKQPDLNWHNPDVQDAILEQMKFWLDKGVDGIRLDAINYGMHDPQLRHNPPRHDLAPAGEYGGPLHNPYGMQMHWHDKTRPEMHRMLERMRQLADQYPGQRFLMGEVSSDDDIRTTVEYSAPGRLHSTYNFCMFGPAKLKDDRSLIERVFTYFQQLEQHYGQAWPSWAFSNHDVMRVMSRWGDGQNPAAAKQFMALLLCLRGTACIYQGEELGLSEANVAYADMQDPYGKTFYPDFKGRDGCRTPMPWQGDETHAGFSAAKPWLPVPAEHQQRAVDIQAADANSVLNFTRDFIQWRKEHPVLVQGEMRFLWTSGQFLGFERRLGDERVVCVFNLSDKAASYHLGDLQLDECLTGQKTDAHNHVKMKPYGVMIASLKAETPELANSSRAKAHQPKFPAQHFERRPSAP